MKLRTNNKGVSQVIGFVLTFAIISMVTTSTIYTVSVLVERRNKVASELIAQDIVNYVVNAIMECTATRQTYPNANYSKMIEIPTTISGRYYYIEAAGSVVYLNATDGYVREKSTTYKQEELSTGILGKVYSANGEITILSNKTGYLYKIE